MKTTASTTDTSPKQKEAIEKIPNDETLQAMKEAESGELEPLDLEQMRKDMNKP